KDGRRMKLNMPFDEELMNSFAQTVSEFATICQRIEKGESDGQDLIDHVENNATNGVLDYFQALQEQVKRGGRPKGIGAGRRRLMIKLSKIETANPFSEDAQLYDLLEKELLRLQDDSTTAKAANQELLALKKSPITRQGQDGDRQKASVIHNLRYDSKNLP